MTTSKNNAMNYILVSLLSVVLGGLMTWFAITTSSDSPQTYTEKKHTEIPAEFTGNLVSLTAGVPGTGKIKEVRTAFLPDETMSVEGKWNKTGKPYAADFVWVGPDKTVVYEKTMDMRPEWTRTHVHYRGPEPMAAGTWHVAVKVDGKNFGSTPYKVVRKKSEIPLKQQIQAFESSKVSENDARTLIIMIRSALRGDTVSINSLPAGLAEKKAKLIVRIFHDGKNTDYFAGTEDTIRESLKTIIGSINADKPFRHIELSVIHKSSRIPTNTHVPRFKLWKNMGFSLKVGSASSTLLPSAIWKKNLNNGISLLRQLAVEAGLKETAWKQENAELYSFYVQQYIIDDRKSAPDQLFFGKTPLRTVSLPDVQETIDLALEWYIYNQHDSGRFLYTYYPDREKEPDDGWCLRDLNAQYVLAEIAVDNKNKQMLNAVKKNLEMYKQGIVEHNGKTFLHWKEHRQDSSISGTAFLMATMILLEDDPVLIKKIAHSIMDLQMENGRFHTDFINSDRDIDQLFYPGETMLALSYYYNMTKDKRVLEVIEKAYGFYTDFFDEKKKDPFVPWQVRSFARFYDITGKKRYADFAFEMMDWLLETYSPITDGLPGKDGALTRRFASTGVYTEGIVTAYKLAKTVGDSKREAYYGTVLRGAAKYLTNLQYKGMDVYQFEKPKKLYGALTIKPFDNELRLDATYHAISGLHMITKMMDAEAFSALEEK